MVPDINLGSQERGHGETSQIERARLDPGETFPPLLGDDRQHWKDLDTQTGKYREDGSTGSKELGAREPQS